MGGRSPPTCRHPAHMMGVNTFLGLLKHAWYDLKEAGGAWGGAAKPPPMCKHPAHMMGVNLGFESRCTAQKKAGGLGGAQPPPPPPFANTMLTRCFSTSFLGFEARFLSSFLASFLPFFLPCLLPFFLPSFLLSFLPCFLPFFLPSFLSFFLSFFPSKTYKKYRLPMKIQRELRFFVRTTTKMHQIL